MKQNFDECLKMLLKHEGGYVNHRSDPGGRTNLGVTQAVYEDWVGHPVTEDDMRALTPEDVAPIYKNNYRDKVRGDDLPAGVDWCAFDWAVNSGSGRPAKAIQRAVGATQDGAIGPMTLQSVADLDPEKIIQSVYHTRQKFYENLKTFKTFGKGWTRRNKETLETALAMVSKPV